MQICGVDIRKLIIKCFRACMVRADSLTLACRTADLKRSCPRAKCEFLGCHSGKADDRLWREPLVCVQWLPVVVNLCSHVTACSSRTRAFMPTTSKY